MSDYIAETALPGLAFPAVKAMVLYQAKEHDLDVSEDSAEDISIHSIYGSYRFHNADGTVQASVTAPRMDWLYGLKESLVDTISHVMPQAVEDMRWSDAGDAGTLPDNFQFITVQSATPVGTDFLRLVVKGSDLSLYGEESIHFRLVLPPAGIADPEWPALNAAGNVVWPKGDKALHRPVYTARAVDHANNLLTFDVFIHEGGRITEWAKQVERGTCIGMTGPGGGGIPDAKRIALYADETGFPAVARILATLPQHVTGTVHMLAEQGSDCGYDLPHHPGLSVHWHTRAAQPELSPLAIADLNQHTHTYIWFASEKADTQKLRAYCKEQGIDTKSHYIAAYWSAPTWSAPTAAQ